MNSLKKLLKKMMNAYEALPEEFADCAESTFDGTDF